MRTRLGAYSQLQNRIRTRITQAMGRCTRDESDYSVVVILGDKLTKRCCTRIFTQGMHPELQAEITFGLENSTDHTMLDFVELSEALLNHDVDWQVAEQEIRKLRDSSTKILDQTTKALAKAMPHEINYVYASWNRRHDEALGIANKILDALDGGSDLKPYRAFWCHQAASSAFLAWKHSGNDAFKTVAISHLDTASSISLNISWLEKLRFEVSGQSRKAVDISLPLQDWFLEISRLLESWGIAGGKFSRQISTAQKNIESKKFNAFENGLESLGKILGAKTHRWKDKGSPDGLWIFGDWCAFVFEAKSDESPDSGIALSTVRQSGSHEDKVRADKLIPSFLPCFTVIISPRITVDTVALPHLKDKFYYISHNEIISLFKDAQIALERVRVLASSHTDEALQTNALQFYKDRSVDLKNVKDRLLTKKLKDLPVHQI